MNHTPVSSSWIDSIGHDPETNTVQIVTKSGKRYDFPDVDPADHAALMAARSVGEHFNKIFRPRYGK